MNIAQGGTSAGLAIGQDRPARTAAYTPRAMLAAAEDARQSAIAGSVADAMSSARTKPDQMVQDMARSQVQALMQRVQILKKLYAGNPREMAHALAQLFKELKAAVKAYQQATGDELGMAGDLASGAVSAAAQTASAPAAQGADGAGQGASPGAAPDGASDADEQAATAAPQTLAARGGADAEASAGATASASDSAQSATPAPTSPTPETPTTTSAPGGASTYAAVTQGVREAFGRDAQSFFGDVRDVARALSDILASARIQAKAARPDKATARAFEDADKQYASLEHALDDADRDLRNTVPTLGLHLSIAA